MNYDLGWHWLFRVYCLSLLCLAGCCSVRNTAADTVIISWSGYDGITGSPEKALYSLDGKPVGIGSKALTMLAKRRLSNVNSVILRIPDAAKFWDENYSPPYANSALIKNLLKQRISLSLEQKGREINTHVLSWDFGNDRGQLLAKDASFVFDGEVIGKVKSGNELLKKMKLKKGSALLLVDPLVVGGGSVDRLPPPEEFGLIDACKKQGIHLEYIQETSFDQ